MNTERSLKLAMLNKGVRLQKELADRADVAELTISRMATGKRVEMSSIEKIAKALDYSVSEFLALGE